MENELAITLPRLYWQEVVQLIEREEVRLQHKVEVFKGNYREILKTEAELCSTILSELRTELELN